MHVLRMFLHMFLYSSYLINHSYIYVHGPNAIGELCTNVCITEVYDS